MELILDANVLFAALIKDSHTRDMILNSGWTFYAPEFLLDEFRKHASELSEKTGLSEEELNSLLDEFITTAEIIIIPFNEFKQFYKEAEEFSPDGDDAPYFALALKLQCAIWSNDAALKKQDNVKLYSTEDIISIFSKKS